MSPVRSGLLDEETGNVLVLEGQAGVAATLCKLLRTVGYAVESVTVDRRGLARACSRSADIVILDTHDPASEGRDTIRRIRHTDGDTPILVFTASTDFVARQKSLDAGATDYLTKPVAPTECRARIRLLLLQRSRDVDRHRLRAGDIELDLITRVARYRGQAIDLATREFQVLAYLVLHTGRLVSRLTLTRALWPHQTPASSIDDALDMYVGGLRNKLDAAGYRFAIEAVRRQGFRLRL